MPRRGRRGDRDKSTRTTGLLICHDDFRDDDDRGDDDRGDDDRNDDRSTTTTTTAAMATKWGEVGAKGATSATYIVAAGTGPEGAATIAASVA